MDDVALPSIWIARWSSSTAWTDSRSERLGWQAAAAAIDDRLTASRHPTMHDAWCAVCAAVTPMCLDWTSAHFTGAGAVEPDWSGSARCARCGSSSRSRAIAQLMLELSARARRTAVVVASTEIEQHADAQRNSVPRGGRLLCGVDESGLHLLETLRAVGFRRAVARQYWAPWRGHLGIAQFVVEAVR